MKLTVLHEAAPGYWKPVSLYGPNQTVKVKKKKHQLSFLKYPEDRARFIKWSSQGKK